MEIGYVVRFFQNLKNRTKRGPPVYTLAATLQLIDPKKDILDQKINSFLTFMFIKC